MQPRRPIRHTLPATAGLLLALAGCGAGDPKPGPEVAGGNAGIDESVSADVKVLDVELEFPLDGAYDIGDGADLYLAISNTGDDADTLVDVTGPDFGDVRSGRTDDADRLAIPVPGNDTVYVGAEGEPTLRLIDLGRTLRSSQSLPVTLVFDRAGPVTVEAVVAAAGQTPGADVDFPDPAEDPSDEG
jgi:copper(I)-binding protein